MSVSDPVPVDGLGYLAFEGPQCFFAGLGGGELVVEAAHIAQQLECDPFAFDLDRPQWPNAAQDPPGLGADNSRPGAGSGCGRGRPR